MFFKFYLQLLTNVCKVLDRKLMLNFKISLEINLKNYEIA